MRLLRRCDDGDFSLSQFSDKAIPLYAILSHTWGADTDEVTFEDLTNGTGRDKPGYEKIRFCGEQAAQDGLEWFWIDTCCIYKMNKAELSDAIRSMFRWYRNATRCYVFLADVPKPLSDTNKLAEARPWEADFRESKWFTRGWTLQELLAPASVEFFSRERNRLGDKRSLIQHIREITGIPDAALEGGRLSQFSDKERFSWIQCRQTKVQEDKAYSLLGIFDVEMPLRYGEGSASAFKRLEEEIDKLNKCLRDLRSTDPQDDKKRIEDTKGGLLKNSYCWILENSDFQQWRNAQQSPILWVKGDPGKGKTMLLCGIVNELKKSTVQSTLLSYFFCQATDARINNATAVLRGLIYMLVSQQPSLVWHIQKKYDHAGKTLFEDVNAWVALSEILSNILQDLNFETAYLIIDALDECVADLPSLLGFIVRTSSGLHRVKWIVSSRNLPSIKKEFEAATEKLSLCLELNEKSVSAAVATYIQFKVDWLAKRNKYGNDTRDAVQSHLLSNAHGTFLWVALVCQELADVPGWDAEVTSKAFPPGLDLLYQRMLDQICASKYAKLCKNILGVISVVRRPIKLDELSSFVDITARSHRDYEIPARTYRDYEVPARSHKDYEVPARISSDYEALAELIGFCGSLLTLRECNISFVHQSAKDFVADKAYNVIFPVGRKHVHYTIFSRSLRIMSQQLRRDVYDLGAPGFPIDRVKQPNPDPLSSARYSCVYWIDHLLDSIAPDNASDYVPLDYHYRTSSCYSTPSFYRSSVRSVYTDDEHLSYDATDDASDFLQDGGSIDKFLRRNYLFWLEALGLCRSLSKGVVSMAKLEALIQKRANASALLELVRDARRFIMYHKQAIEDAPLQAYASALMFSPARSLIRNLFKLEESKRIAIKPPMREEWSACHQTLEGHSGTVYSVAFSHGSNCLASASSDKTVMIWDASSGECLRTLEGHSSTVYSVAFSLDLTRVASASDDKTVKIWDANSGEFLRTLEGHSSTVWSVAFSNNSTHLASSSSDGTVKMWDANSGECLQTFTRHSSTVWSVAFSHDSTCLASASYDNSVKIWPWSGDSRWRLRDDWPIRTLENHSYGVKSVAFSHNSTYLASASGDRTVKIWDTNSGSFQTLPGHSEAVCSVAFSRDSTRLASASNDRTVKIWDTSEDKLVPNRFWRAFGTASSVKCLQTLEGHNSMVWSVVFMHDSTRLASASSDKTVKIWNTSGVGSIRYSGSHHGAVSSVAFSRDSTRLASASGDRTIKIWNTSNGECLRTLEGHSATVKSVAFSQDSTRLASASDDSTVKIWDTSSGECLQTFEGHSVTVKCVAFSSDSTRLASSSGDRTVKIWDTSSGECLQTLQGHSSIVWSAAFSGDLTRLASASGDKKVKIWDTSSGECLRTLEGHSGTVYSVAFSLDLTRVASASDDKTVKIWDTSSSECLETLQIGKTLFDISFNATGSYLHTQIGTIAIRASSSLYTSSDQIEPQEPQYLGAGLSSDGVWITYNAEKVVWLPSEYRPSCSAVSAETVSIGVGSGKIWMCSFHAEKR